MFHPARLAALVTLGLAAGCTEPQPAPTADLSEQQVVYGTDDRLDYYQVGDASLRALANATAAQFNTWQIGNAGGGRYSVDSSPTLAQEHSPMCGSEPFRTQPATASCTAFMVGPDTIATAGHCISSSTCNSTAWVFGFRMDGASNPRTVVDAQDVYTCDSIVDRASSGTLDYAIVRVDRTITGRSPMSVRSSGVPANGTPLVLLGHPSGLPVKIAGNAVVKSSSTNTISANVDSYGGNSGSPVVNANTLQVEGILVRGNDDYVWSGSCYRSNVCSNNGCPGFEDATRASRWASSIPGGGTTPPACTDDAYEDNDSRSGAAPWRPGSTSGLQVCSGDEDWYAIDLFAGETLTATASFAHGGGDLDMQLWDGSGEVDRSDSTTNSETVSVTAPSNRTYYVVVYGYQNAQNSYSLNVQTSGAPQTCNDDGFEPNDSRATAATVPISNTLNLQVCSGDEDWFAVPVGAGDVVTATIGFSHADGDLDMVMYLGGVELDRSDSITDGEMVQATAPAAGTVQVVVYGYQGAANRYTLEVQTTGGATPVGDFDLATLGTPSAGSNVRFQVSDAPPNADVYVVYGNPGSFALRCGLTLDVGSPYIYEQVRTDGAGDAVASRWIPASAAGRSYRFQAVSAADCEASPAIDVTFR